MRHGARGPGHDTAFGEVLPGGDAFYPVRYRGGLPLSVGSDLSGHAQGKRRDDPQRDVVIPATMVCPRRDVLFHFGDLRSAAVSDGSWARNAVRQAIEKVRKKFAFEIATMVLLPDHLHAIWTLPMGDGAYPLRRWKRIKELFTRDYLAAGGSEVSPSASRLHHGERGVWQRRYWEHTVDDEDDLKRFVDYVHWNHSAHPAPLPFPSPRSTMKPTPLAFF